MRSSTEVLVIGAGPVGLLLACELHRRGVDYLFGYLSGDQTKSDQGAFANLLSIIRQGLDRSAAAVAILHPQAHFVDCEMMPVLIDQDGSFQRLYFACPRHGLVSSTRWTPCLALLPRRSAETRPFSGSIWIKRG